MNPEVFEAMALQQETHWWFVARRRILASLIADFSLPENSDVLELGCGPGGNLAMLSRFGKVEAMECDLAACEVANRLSICQVVHACLPETTAFSGKRFDLICLFDVLEHIQDDALALRTAAGLLKPAGRLLITVPAYAWLWSGHDTAHHHQRRYTRESLANLAQMAGLKVERIGYFNSLLFPAIAAARLLGKLTGRDNESDAKTPSRLVNSVLQNIFQSERHVLRRRLFPFGTSVLATFTMPT